MDIRSPEGILPIQIHAPSFEKAFPNISNETIIPVEVTGDAIAFDIFHHVYILKNNGCLTYDLPEGIYIGFKVEFQNAIKHTVLLKHNAEQCLLSPDSVCVARWSGEYWNFTILEHKGIKKFDADNIKNTIEDIPITAANLLELQGISYNDDYAKVWNSYVNKKRDRKCANQFLYRQSYAFYHVSKKSGRLIIQAGVNSPLNTSLIYSDDEGTSWNTCTTKGMIFPCTITELPDGTLLSADSFCTIYRSDDDGKSWYVFSVLPLYDSNEEGKGLGRIVAVTNDIVIWFGITGIGIYHSLNGGLNWRLSEHSAKGDEASIPVKTRNSCIIWAGGSESRGIFTSSDLGINWTFCESVALIKFYNIIFLKNNELLAMTVDGHIYRSNDDGVSWNVIPTIANIDSLPIQLENGRIITTTRDPYTNTLYAVYSDNNGTDWQKSPIPFFYNIIHHIMQLSNGTIIASSRQNEEFPKYGIIYSNDNGITWNVSNVTNAYFLYPIRIPSRKTLMVGDKDIYSTKNGQVWEKTISFNNFCDIMIGQIDLVSAVSSPLWTVLSDGLYKSPATNTGTSSEILVTLNNRNNIDSLKLNLYLAIESGPANKAIISGVDGSGSNIGELTEIDREEYSITIPPGEHFIKISFVKNGDGSGSDAAYFRLRNINTPIYESLENCGIMPDAVCANGKSIIASVTVNEIDDSLHEHNTHTNIIYSNTNGVSWQLGARIANTKHGSSRFIRFRNNNILYIPEFTVPYIAYSGSHTSWNPTTLSVGSYIIAHENVLNGCAVLYNTTTNELYYTNDNGESFKLYHQHQLSIQNAILKQIFYNDKGTLFGIADNSCKFYTSKNDGFRWTAIESSDLTSPIVYMTHIANGDLIAAVDDSNHQKQAIYFYKDNGVQWIQSVGDAYAPSEIIQTRTGILIGIINEAFAGISGIIHSHNNGRSWIKVSDISVISVFESNKGHIFYIPKEYGFVHYQKYSKKYGYSAILEYTDLKQHNFIAKESGVAQTANNAIYFATKNFKIINTSANELELEDAVRDSDYHTERNTPIRIVVGEDDLLIAGSKYNGIKRSFNHGISFLDTNITNGGYENPRLLANKTLIVGSDSHGILYSTDLGATWTPSSISSGAWNTPVPVNDVTLIATSKKDNGIAFSLNSGRTWSISNVHTGSFDVPVIDPEHPSIVYAGSLSNGGILKSNTLNTWNKLQGTATRPSYIAADPFTYTIKEFKNIPNSDNASILLTSTHDILYSLNGQEWALHHSFDTMETVDSLFVTDTKRVIVRADDRLYYSDDNGISWTQTNLDMLNEVVFYESADKSIIIVSSRTGASPIYYSTNNGEWWIQSVVDGNGSPAPNSGDDMPYEERFTYIKEYSGMYIAHGIAGIYSSSNGMDWEILYQNTENSILDLIIKSGNGELVATQSTYPSDLLKGIQLYIKGDTNTWEFVHYNTNATTAVLDMIPISDGNVLIVYKADAESPGHPTPEIGYIVYQSDTQLDSFGTNVIISEIIDSSELLGYFKVKDFIYIAVSSTDNVCRLYRASLNHIGEAFVEITSFDPEAVPKSVSIINEHFIQYTTTEDSIAHLFVNEEGVYEPYMLPSIITEYPVSSESTLLATDDDEIKYKLFSYRTMGINSLLLVDKVEHERVEGSWHSPIFSSNNLMIIGSADDNGIRYSSDNGETWNLSNIIYGSFTIIKPHDHKDVFFALSYTEVYSSIDGIKWSIISSDSGSSSIVGIQAYKNESYLVLYKDGSLCTTGDVAIKTSVEYTQSDDTVQHYTNIKSLVILDEEWFCAGHEKGIIHTFDHGRHWVTASHINDLEKHDNAAKDLDKSLGHITRMPDSSLVSGGSIFDNNDNYVYNNAIMRSVDNGYSWYKTVDTITGYYRIVYMQLNRVALALPLPVYQDPDHVKNPIYRSTDFGDTWEVSFGSAIVPYVNSFVDQIVETSSKRIILVTTDGILYSEDAGIHWELAECELTLLDSETEKSRSRMCGIIYTGTAYYAYIGKNIVTSQDGITWESVVYEDLILFMRKNAYWTHILYKNSILSLYANSYEVFYSTDDGVNWEIASGPSGIEILDVAVIKDTIFIIGRIDDANRIYYSTNNGISWDILSNEIFDFYRFILIQNYYNELSLIGCIRNSKTCYITQDGSTWSNISDQGNLALPYVENQNLWGIKGANPVFLASGNTFISIPRSQDVYEGIRFNNEGVIERHIIKVVDKSLITRNHALTRTKSGKLFTGTNRLGLAYSTNNGISWTLVKSVLRDLMAKEKIVDYLITTSETLNTFTATGIRAMKENIVILSNNIASYYSNDGLKTFNAMVPSHPVILLRHDEFNGIDASSRTYAFVRPISDIDVNTKFQLVYTNDGQTWIDAHDDIQGRYIEEVGNDIVFAIASTNAVQGILRSFDNGASWYATTIVEGVWGRITKLSNGTLVVSRWRTEASIEDEDEDNYGIWYSNSDEGESFEQSSITRGSFFIVQTTDGSGVFAFSMTDLVQGIYLTNDFGETWETICETGIYDIPRAFVDGAVAYNTLDECIVTIEKNQDSGSWDITETEYAAPYDTSILFTDKYYPDDCMLITPYAYGIYDIFNPLGYSTTHGKTINTTNLNMLSFIDTIPLEFYEYTGNTHFTRGQDGIVYLVPSIHGEHKTIIPKIYKSYDGRVWIPNDINLQNHFDIHISSPCEIDSGHLVACTDHNTFYQSSDGGNTWTQKSFITEHNEIRKYTNICHTTSIHAPFSSDTIPNRILFSGPSGIEYGDVATNIFDIVIYPSHIEKYGHIYSPIETSKRSIIAGTSKGGIIRSTDNGETFSLVYSSIGFYFSFSITSTGIIYAGGFGMLVYSEDDGSTWRAANIESVYAPVQTVTKSLIASSTIGLGVYYTEKFKLDEEGRRIPLLSWAQSNLSTGTYIPPFIMPNGRVIVGSLDADKGIYYSDNDGILWHKVNADINGPVDNPVICANCVAVVSGITNKVYSSPWTA